MTHLALYIAELMPKANSSYASQVDALYWYLNIVTAFFTILIATLVVFFCIKYRRRSEDERPEEIHGNNFLEIFWSVVPFLFMLVMFVWGTTLHYKATHPPEDAMEILVTGKQWMWKVQHPNGKREINDLHVPQGRPIQLTITSEDVIHSYYIPVQRLKRDAVPGRYTTYWFEAKDQGQYHIFCAEYCGAEHSMMKGTMHVMSQSDYDAWLETGYNAPTMDIPLEADIIQAASAAPAPATSSILEMGDEVPDGFDLTNKKLIAKGKELFNSATAFGGTICGQCHRPGTMAASIPTNMAPDFQNWWGGVSTLTDGTKVRRDYAYFLESIRMPMAKIAKFDGVGAMAVIKQPTEDQVVALAAYVHSLNAE